LDHKNQAPPISARRPAQQGEQMTPVTSHASSALFGSRRRLLGALAAGALALAFAGPAAAEAGKPIRIGSTLALTGPLASTAIVHKIVGEMYVEELNKRGGLLGRPVEWVLLDDQSKPDLTRTLYEKLITDDKVDLVIGPYATGGILSAMAVAERHGKMLIHHTFGIPGLAKYDMQFGTWALGPVPEQTVPAALLDALAGTGHMPKTIAVVTSKFPSVHFLALGMRDVAKKRGLNEVLYLEYEFGSRDFGPVAARIKDANPDLLWVGAVGLEGNQVLDALKKIDYTPKNHFYAYPAPGPLALSPEGKNAISTTMFEAQPPMTDNPIAGAFAKEYEARAKKAGLPYTAADVQAAVSFTAWQVLEAAVTNAKTLDDKVLAQWLKTHGVDSIIGKLRFDGPHNYGDDLTKIKQVQNGKWTIVWPKQYAMPGAQLTAQ
jgi:branched-chain amino acid transport system substrate-binding protein